MFRPTFIVLNKTEWDRLKKQGGPLEEPKENKKEEYLKTLTEQSQEWIRTWPDSVAGHVKQLEKQKKKQHKADIEFIKNYTKKQKQKNTAEALKKAKELIFQDSNYGRQLISALLESRSLEVRKAQIEFQKEIQQKAAEAAKEQEKNQRSAIANVHDKDEEREKIDKLKALECAKFNKEMVSQKKQEELKIKEIEKQGVIEDAKLMKEVLVIEELEKQDIEQCRRRGIEKYEAEKKEIEKLKAQEKELDDALTEVYKKGQDRLKCKMQMVTRKIILGRPDTEWSKNLYKKVDELQNKDNKRYDDFINKGIKTYEQRASEKEEKDKIREKAINSNKILIPQVNKVVAEEERLAKMCENKFACDRQSLPLKTGGIKKAALKTDQGTKSSKYTTEEFVKDEDTVQKLASKTVSECDREVSGGNKTERLSFLRPRNKLIEELRRREKDPSPFTATKGVHAHFAQQANDCLKEIRHKHFARKVVDEYRKLNCLDATTLPIPDY